MKITRLKRGYRIHLSDSEYIGLRDLVIRGEGELEGLTEHDWKVLRREEPDAVRGYRTITGSGSWAIDSDRRGS